MFEEKLAPLFKSSKTIQTGSQRIDTIVKGLRTFSRLDEGDEVLLEMYGDRESARQDTALLHVHPLNWPRHQYFCCDPADERWFESADRLRMKLGSLGVMFERDLETTGGGHGFDYYNRMAEKAVGFLHNGLERERLRVV